MHTGLFQASKLPYHTGLFQAKLPYQYHHARTTPCTAPAARARAPQDHGPHEPDETEPLAPISIICLAASPHRPRRRRTPGGAPGGVSRLVAGVRRGAGAGGATRPGRAARLLETLYFYAVVP